MSELSKRSTVYFEPEIHHALRMKAATTDISVSEMVNEAVRIALREDQEDLGAFEDRADEPTLSHEELLKDLESHGYSLAFIKSVAKRSSKYFKSGCKTDAETQSNCSAKIQERRSVLNSQVKSDTE